MSPITVLDGLDDAIVDMLRNEVTGLENLGEFIQLEDKHYNTYTFLKESGMIPELDRLIQKAKKLFQKRSDTNEMDEEKSDDPKIELPNDTQNTLISNEENISKSISLSDLINDQNELLLNNINLEDSYSTKPISILEGITEDGTGFALENHAFIYNIEELASFPENFPGMYQVFILSGIYPNLEKYVNDAKKLTSFEKSFKTKLQNWNSTYVIRG